MGTQTRAQRELLEPPNQENEKANNIHWSGPINVQDTTLVIVNNVQTIIDDIVPEQDNNEVLLQIPIEQS